MSPYVANVCPLAAEIGLGVWGTPANFNGFRVLASLLKRCRSPEANQTLHDVWPSHGWYTIFTFSGVLAPDGILQNFILCPCLAFSLHWQCYCTALQQLLASAKLCGVVQGMELRHFRRGRHLYSSGWPSRWAPTLSILCVMKLVVYIVIFCVKMVELCTFTLTDIVCGNICRSICVD